MRVGNALLGRQAEQLCRFDVILGDAIAFDDSVTPEWRQLLMEAETSGGLLLSVDPSQADDVVDALKLKGCAQAAVVGRVIEGESGRIEVRA